MTPDKEPPFIDLERSEWKSERNRPDPIELLIDAAVAVAGFALMLYLTRYSGVHEAISGWLRENVF